MADRIRILSSHPPIVTVTGQRRPTKRSARRPTLVGVAKQAAKAAIPVARYEVKPDGTVIVHTGEPDTGKQPGNELDDWLAKHAH